MDTLPLTSSTDMLHTCAHPNGRLPWVAAVAGCMCVCPKPALLTSIRSQPAWFPGMALAFSFQQSTLSAEHTCNKCYCRPTCKLLLGPAAGSRHVEEGSKQAWARKVSNRGLKRNHTYMKGTSYLVPSSAARRACSSASVAGLHDVGGPPLA